VGPLPRKLPCLGGHRRLAHSLGDTARRGREPAAAVTRDQVEHLIRAAAAVADERRTLVAALVARDGKVAQAR
jgi:hypothetical protein